MKTYSKTEAMKTPYWQFWKKQPKNVENKSKVREWWDSILFAVVAATLIRWAFMEAYTIPTQSMEKSLLVGDFLFVSKIHYGPRTPTTPLQVPLTHQTIWGTSIPSYLNWIQLPTFRFPGFTDVKKGDCVVFNWPADQGYPMDLKTYYIKRCVATAGDRIEVRNKQVYINGQAQKNPEKMEHRYTIATNEPISERVFKKLDITEKFQSNAGIDVLTTESTVLKLRDLNFITSVTDNIRLKGEGDPRVFPSDSKYMWNEDNFGPLLLPAEGMRIKLTALNIPLYEKVILEYESNVNARVEDGRVFIDGKEVTEYTFKQNYYFMMGDNRDNSLDSRFWGFVPKDHIVGKAVFIWMSLNPQGSILEKVRWNRLFRLVD